MRPLTKHACLEDWLAKSSINQNWDGPHFGLDWDGRATNGAQLTGMRARHASWLSPRHAHMAHAQREGSTGRHTNAQWRVSSVQIGTVAAPASCQEPYPHASCPMPHASCPMPHALCLMPHASCPMPHASCLMPHGSCLMPHASYLMPHASCLMPHASCLMLPSPLEA